MREAAPYFEENLKIFGPLRLHRGLSEEQIAAISNPAIAPTAGLPSIEEAAAKGAYLCGPPEHLIERLQALQDKYPGLQRVTVGQPVGASRKVILEQLEWFASAVMPAFRVPAATK